MEDNKKRRRSNSDVFPQNMDEQMNIESSTVIDPGLIAALLLATPRPAIR